jgi:hypothetical protein
MRPGHQKAARVGVFEYGHSLYVGVAVKDGMHGLVAQLARGIAIDEERPEAVVYETGVILVSTNLISRQ